MPSRHTQQAVTESLIGPERAETTATQRYAQLASIRGLRMNAILKADPKANTTKSRP
jgi:hypothetical protein